MRPRPRASRVSRRRHLTQHGDELGPGVSLTPTTSTGREGGQEPPGAAAELEGPPAPAGEVAPPPDAPSPSRVSEFRPSAAPPRAGVGGGDGAQD